MTVDGHGPVVGRSVSPVLVTPVARVSQSTHCVLRNRQARNECFDESSYERRREQRCGSQTNTRKRQKRVKVEKRGRGTKNVYQRGRKEVKAARDFE